MLVSVFFLKTNIITISKYPDARTVRVDYFDNGTHRNGMVYIPFFVPFIARDNENVTFFKFGHKYPSFQ